MNKYEHWRKAYKRHQTQKTLVALSMRSANLSIDDGSSITIRLVRISPRRLDDDNLPPAFKWIRDSIADYLKPGLRPGRADDDIRFTWVYDQVKGKPGEQAIQIEIHRTL